MKIERTNRPIALLWIVSEVDDSKEARLLRALLSEKLVYRVRNQQQHLLRIQSCGYQIPPIHSRELQSRERRSLTLKSSAKGILPEFECRAQKRVHVETALIFITPAALCATGERHLRRMAWKKRKNIAVHVNGMR